MAGFLYILLAIVTFGVLIFIHELGHFLAARATGVGVKEFAIGMGPKLVSHKSKKSGTVYSLRLLLIIGGFTSMVGEDESVEDSGAFNKKAWWKRIIILAAGGVMNILLGFIVMTMLVSAQSAFNVPQVLKFKTDDAQTASYGLQPGDRILRVGSRSVNIMNDLVFAVMETNGNPVDLVVRNDGVTRTIPGVQFPTETDQGMTYGVLDFYTTTVAASPGQVVYQSFFQSLSTVNMIWSSLIDLITGKYGISQLSGPVGVTAQLGQAAQAGLPDFAFMFVVIAVNLGIVNLLPLPALDGGRIVFVIVEAIRRKPVPAKYEGIIHAVGFILLIGLMILITFKDLVSCFSG